MDKSMLFDHLAKAEEHVALGEKHVEYQAALVARMQFFGWTRPQR
jgi:hypothetical protein